MFLVIYIISVESFCQILFVLRTIINISAISGLPDTLLAGIGILSCLGASLTKALTMEAWHMYLSLFIGIFGGVLGPVARSIISKSAPVEDIGEFESCEVDNFS